MQLVRLCRNWSFPAINQFLNNRRVHCIESLESVLDFANDTKHFSLIK